MNEDNILHDEEFSESPDGSAQVSDSVDEESQVLDRTDEVAEDLKQDSEETEEEREEEKPSSTVIQVTEDNESDSGYDIVELDVDSLNIMSQSYVEQLQTVSPTSNDYYSYIDGDILEYFQGIMANKPLNSYRACHLRHWIQNTQYYSYYDDYYYLWYDLDNGNDYVEIVKYNGQSNYVVNWGSGTVLNSTITYGSGDNQSDFRKGVTYVQEMAFLSVLACLCVLYIVNAIFRHLRS